MTRADRSPLLIDGQPVEFSPSFQLTTLQGAVADFLATRTTRDRARLAEAHRLVRWYQQADAVARVCRWAAEAGR